jgi:hypothetical protein
MLLVMLRDGRDEWPEPDSLLDILRAREERESDSKVVCVEGAEGGAAVVTMLGGSSDASGVLKVRERLRED